MTEFSVPDMHCDGCVRSISAALRAALPAAGIEIDLAAHRLRVTGAAEAKTVIEILQDAGYTPALVPA